MNVTCFGELLVRLTPPDHRLLAQADRLVVSVGGAEANVAVALAALGHRVRFCGCVSDDGLGERAVAALRGAGVDVGQLRRAPGRMGLYFHESGRGARPARVIYDRAASAFVRADPDDIDFAGALQGSRLLVIGGITPALGPGGVALARAALAAAHRAGAAVAFDFNYREQLWNAWDGDPAGILRELAAGCTILIAGARDLSLVLADDFADDGEGRRAAASAAFAAWPKLQLIASTTRCVQAGDRHLLAAHVHSRQGAHDTEAVDLFDIVERIGSGDAFAAGVLDGWLADQDNARMARAGLALAALKHTLPGDHAPITRTMMAGFGATSGDIRR